MPDNTDSDANDLRRFQKDVFPRCPPGSISGDEGGDDRENRDGDKGGDEDGDEDKNKELEHENETTIQTRYTCPVNGTPDDDGMAPNELREHLVAEHTLRERIDALVRSADPAN